MLKLLKHVRLIIFENYNDAKNLFLIKKAVTQFDKKIATWRKKSMIDEEKNLLLCTLKKKTPSLKTQRRRYH